MRFQLNFALSGIVLTPAGQGDDSLSRRGFFPLYHVPGEHAMNFLKIAENFKNTPRQIPGIGLLDTPPLFVL